MVRVEHLRAKSLQAEVAYLKDLKRVGDFKRIESESRATLHATERNFWSEAVKAQIKEDSRGAAKQPPPEIASFRLERMRRAHDQHRRAANEHALDTQKLQSGIVELSTSQKRIELLEKLVAKASRARANRIESRLSEELEDLVASAARTGGPSGNRFSPQAPHSTSRLPHPTDTRSDLTTEPSNTERKVPVQLQLPARPAMIPRVDQQERSLNPVSVVVRDVSAHSSEGRSSLALSCALGKSGTVGLALVRESTGALSVKLDPGIGGLVSTLLRERAHIQSKLQTMGLNITSLEIGSADGTNYSLSRRARRALTEADEDIIT